MAQTVGQHTVATFTTPLNGTSPIDATTVRTNDNTLRIGYNDHDVDAGIHLQSSLLASRPGASDTGRKWMTTDTGAVKVFFDTGSTWVEISYLPITGGTVTGPVTVTGLLTASGGVAGNASTATALQTARTINGVSFDGTANITVTAAANTLTGSTLASGVTGSSLTSVGTLTTGAIGAGFTAIPNTALANSSVTVNGTAIALGASGTVTAAAGTLTGSTLASGVTASSLTSLGTLSALAVTGTTTLNTVAYTWPSTDGSSGQVLSTNGSGTLSWIFTGGGGSIATLTAGSFLTGGSFNGTLAATFAVDATDASTASKVVSRDGSGASSFDAVKFDGATSGTVTVKAAAVAGTWDLTLPTTDGDAGQVLTTNGSGVTSWATVSPVNSTITPTTFAPYSITTADVGKRLVMTSTTQGVVRFDNANTSAIAVGSTVGLVSLGAGTVLNVPIDTPVVAPNVDVYSTAVQSDGKIILVGTFVTVGGTTRNRIARINTDGTLDTGYNPNANAQVTTVALQSDGKAVIGGSFTTVGGTARNRIARINTDGTLDTGYDPNAGGNVTTIAIQSSDGKALAGGAFTTVGGTGRNRIARINTDGTLDTGYNPNADDLLNIIAIQSSDGKALIGGDFLNVGGTARNRIARLNTDGTLDTGYNPDANFPVSAIAIQSSDGKAVVGGTFSAVAGTGRLRIARINTDGTLDTGYNPGSGSTITTILAIVFQSDGKAVVGGNFTNLTGGTARNRIARINTDGTLDTGYNPDANGIVRAIAISGTNHLIGGAFTTIGGLTANYLARVPATAYTFNSIRAPYANATTLDQYTVLTLEKITSTEWLITASNDS